MADYKTFNTRALKPSQRLNAWNDCVSQAFAACVVDADREFVASYDKLMVDDCRLSRVQGDAAKIQIFGQSSLRPEDKLFAIMAHDSGVAEYEMAGKKFIAGTDEFVFIDMAQPFSVDVRTDNKDLYKILIPHREFAHIAPQVEALAGLRFSRSSGAGALLNSLWSGIWQNAASIPDGSSRLLTDAIKLLVTTSQVERAESRNRHLPKIVDFVSANLADEQLCTANIARSLHMSERSVQLAFAEMQTTPSQYIRRQRLQLASERLRTDRARVSEIAFDTGYSDMSLFTRQFKQQFNATPSQYRKRFV